MKLDEYGNKKDKFSIRDGVLVLIWGIVFLLFIAGFESIRTENQTLATWIWNGLFALIIISFFLKK